MNCGVLKWFVENAPNAVYIDLTINAIAQSESMQVIQYNIYYTPLNQTSTEPKTTILLSKLNYIKI